MKKGVAGPFSLSYGRANGLFGLALLSTLPSLRLLVVIFLLLFHVLCVPKVYNIIWRKGPFFLCLMTCA